MIKKKKKAKSDLLDTEFGMATHLLLMSKSIRCVILG